MVAADPAGAVNVAEYERLGYPVAPVNVTDPLPGASIVCAAGPDSVGEAGCATDTEAEAVAVCAVGLPLSVAVTDTCTTCPGAVVVIVRVAPLPDRSALALVPSAT
jgi:hypothetical protein